MRFKLHYESWIFKLPWMKPYAAIVLGRSIHFKYPKHLVNEVVVHHELVHQTQMDQHGVIGFYLKYVWYYVKNIVKYKSHWEAYYAIPFEKEAYRKQYEGNPYERQT